MLPTNLPLSPSTRLGTPGQILRGKALQLKNVKKHSKLMKIVQNMLQLVFYERLYYSLVYFDMLVSKLIFKNMAI